ncbi:MAG: SagB family peptide dehydrogenase [Xanthobacteraceae bacterium]
MREARTYRHPGGASPAGLFARLVRSVSLEAGSSGEVFACFDDEHVRLGQFSPAATARVPELSIGLALGGSASVSGEADTEIEALVRRLARHGLLEYRLARSLEGEDEVVIEPQVPDYWPRTAQLDGREVLLLSRFAYLRRRADQLVLESPLAPALFRICDPKMGTMLASLCSPQRMEQLLDDFSCPELLGLLVDSQVLFATDPARDGTSRSAEGDEQLVLWDFHDLLFHARSTEGRHANPLGGRYPYTGVIAPLPAVRPRWPGRKVDLRKSSRRDAEAASPAVKLLHQRHSTRSFDHQRPIALEELSHLLDRAARVQAKWRSPADDGSGGPVVDYAARSYPSAGASYELELYLTVHQCEGLGRGFYHYDAARHALVPIDVRPQDLEAMLAGAEFAMGASAPPQVLITMAARFGRVAWKYSAVAYQLILKDVGVLTQTLYLMATDMGLGGCAIGSANIDLFAKMTGIEFHVEGAVGQFALGRGTSTEADEH